MPHRTVLTILTLTLACPTAQAAKMRVLLFADAPTREYQLARTLFVREVERNRAEITLLVQPGRRAGIFADVPTDRVFDRFPSSLDGDPKVKGDGLREYDLIIAFDPDWSKLTKEQAAALRKWVEKEGGGLIVVAGLVHLHKLTGPVLDLLPVVPDRPPAEPKFSETPLRLSFYGKGDFLKLDPEKKGDLAGWSEFFEGKPLRGGEAEPQGFHGPCPVKAVRDGAEVHARIETAGLGRECTPYLASRAAGKGRVVYVGSGELWRLRKYREAFHERFWLQLAAFATTKE